MYFSSSFKELGSERKTSSDEIKATTVRASSRQFSFSAAISILKTLCIFLHALNLSKSKIFVGYF
jgi:hypothetical protein